MIFAVDFDGTCVTFAFPKVGKNIGAGPVLRLLVSKGHAIILYTMRDDVEKKFPEEVINTQKEAEEWFKKENIPLYGINRNPHQNTWTKSNKVFAHYYIDDQSLGVDLLHTKEKYYINWYSVVDSLKNLNIISQEEKLKLYNEITEELKLL